jgi:hypothetical protein
MKTNLTALLALLLAGLGSAWAAEHVWENFDELPLGSVANQPGWAGFMVARTAQVSNVQAHSPDNSLRFAWNTNSPNATAATHTNLNVRLGGMTGQVVRADFHLFIQSTNTPFMMALVPLNGASLVFQNPDGAGQIGFEPYHPTRIPLIVNRFVPVTMLYHAGRNQYALEYDGERVVDWSNAERPTAATQYTHALFLRSGDTLSSQGDMFVDNVRIETYPYEVWAWWRCTWADNLRVSEQLGQFKPAWRTVLATAVSPAHDPVWDGRHDFRNEGATRNLVSSPASNAVATPVATNWTLEAVVRLSEDRSQTLFEWGRDLGFNSTEALIGLRYQAGLGLGFELRDAQQSTTDYQEQVTVRLELDERWHHVAMVKSGTNLLTYIDYQMVASTPLNAFSRGGYTFGTQTRAVIGRALNNAAHVAETTAVDEVRFSSRSLEPYDFLQPARPWIVRMAHDPGDNTWSMLFKGILGRTYRIETSPVLGPGENWTVESDDYEVDSTYSPFWSNTSTTKRFVRIIRK